MHSPFGTEGLSPWVPGNCPAEESCLGPGHTPFLVDAGVSRPSCLNLGSFRSTPSFSFPAWSLYGDCIAAQLLPVCFLPSLSFVHRHWPWQHFPGHFPHTRLHLRVCFLEHLPCHTRCISIRCDWSVGQVQWRIHGYLFSYAWVIPVSYCFKGQPKII